MNRGRLNSVVLIGMPGAGKTTLGKQLAITLDKTFIDSDRLIEDCLGKTLQQTVEESGYQYLREVEQSVLLELVLDNCVLATGGSAVYGVAAMQHINSCARVVYLHATLETLESRINNYESRGLAKPDDQSFADLFSERHVLYERYSHARVDVSGTSVGDSLQDLLASLGEASGK